MTDRSQVCIRRGGDADVAALVDLVAEFRDELREAEPSRAQIEGGVRRLLMDASCNFLLAHDPGRPGDGASETRRAVGYAQVRQRYSLWAGGYECELEDLFVLPAARRRGVASSLLEAALASARDRGASVIGLSTNELNLQALALYAGAGFRSELAPARYPGGRQLWLRKRLGAAEPRRGSEG